MDDLVRAGGNDVFLDQHFNSIGDRLKKAEWTDAIRAVTILHAPKNFAVEDRNQGKEGQENAEERDNVDEAGSNLNQPIRRPTANEGEQPLFRVDENLVERIAHAR